MARELVQSAILMMQSDRFLVIPVLPRAPFVTPFIRQKITADCFKRTLFAGVFGYLRKEDRQC